MTIQNRRISLSCIWPSNQLITFTFTPGHFFLLVVVRLGSRFLPVIVINFNFVIVIGIQVLLILLLSLAFKQSLAFRLLLCSCCHQSSHCCQHLLMLAFLLLLLLYLPVIGLFYHFDDGMTEKYLVHHRHRYRHFVPLIRHRHSPITIIAILFYYFFKLI